MNSLKKLVMVGAVAVLSACGPKTTADIVRDARAQMAAEKFPEAMIELKTALQEQPKSAELRYLLGVSLAKSGNPAGAEIELRKASELGYPIADVAPALTDVMLARFMYQKLIDEFEPVAIDRPDAQIAVKVAVATAHAKLANRPAAERIVQAALEKQPTHAGALILKARLLIGTDRMATSETILNDLARREPGNPEVWQAVGDLRSFGGEDLDGALEAFRKVVSLRAKSPMAYAAIGSILLHQQKISELEVHFKAMKQAMPSSPDTAMLEANLSFLKGEHLRVREQLQQLLRYLPDSARLLQLAAANEIKLGAYQQAEAFLNRALQQAPDLAPARRMLAQIYLRNGQSQRAMSVLQPLLGPDSRDPLALMLAGETSLLEGDLQSAEARFRAAQALAPAGVQVGVAVALNDLAKGQTSVGLTQLEALASTDAGTVADMALIGARLKLRQLPQALQAVDLLAKKQPNSAKPLNLKGRILLLSADRPGARAAFEEGLRKDKLYFPSVVSLAAMDMEDKRPEAARGRFDEVLKIEPGHVQAHLALAEWLIRTGAAKDEVARKLDAAVRADPNNPQSRLLQIDFFTKARDFKAALSAAQAAITAMPGNVELIDALGGAYLLSGDFNQALTNFHKVAASRPKFAGPLLRVADAQLMKGEALAAITTLRRALDLEPGNAMAQRNLIALYRKGGQSGAAYQVAAGIQKANSGSAAGHAFEGDIAAEQKDWGRAAKAFREGLTKSNGGELATRLHSALIMAGKLGEADAFGRSWLDKNPRDVQFLMYIGDKALEANDLSTAEQRYAQVLSFDANNVFAMNNRAWVQARQGKAGAVKLAQDAVALVPESPVLLDTLAFALSQEKQYAKAIEAEKKAILIAPQNMAYRLNLAKLHVRAGDKPAAVAELEALSKQPLESKTRQAVATMLKSLQ